MGNNSFAPGSRNPLRFIVQNITIEPKTIMIFNYPINPGCTRDLLKIPGVAEDDIRSALLKGQIKHKILTGDIKIISSDIDLLQFNTAQLVFLQSAGIINGLQIGYTELDGYVQSLFNGGGNIPGFIQFVDNNGPVEEFANGAVRVITPMGNPFPTEICWYLDGTLTTKLVDKLITYNSSKFPIIIQWRMYDPTGLTVIHTVTDTITYDTAFESSRSRVIS